MEKKKIFSIIGASLAILLLLLFVIYPAPTAGMQMKVYFPDGSGECRIYYSTTEMPYFNEEQTISAEINEKKRYVTLAFEPELAKNILDLRFDFPTTQDSYRVSKVELISGSLIQKSYTAEEFFAAPALVTVQDIESMNPTENQLKIVTGADPMVVFSVDRVAEIKGAFSHYTMTKSGIAIFLVVTWIFNRKKMFGLKKEEKEC